MKVKLYNNKIVYFEWQNNIVFCDPNININDLPTVEIADPPEDWLQNWNFYDYIPDFNEYVFNEQLKQQEDYLRLVNEIRQKRESQCFSVIDKSQLWYNNLTNKQLEQLNAWYKAWLKAPETQIIPAKPDWL